MIKLGLIGYPLSHSFSEKYFAEKFEKEGIEGIEYRNYPIEDLGGLMKLLEGNPELVGLNVTIPYKQDVIPMLDLIDSEAREVGAVNTLEVIRSGDEIRLKGYNTDVYGFRESLTPLLAGEQKTALILGTGGASKAVAYVLDELGFDHRFVSRTWRNGGLKYEDLCLSIMRNCSLIVNTTPLGTWPDISLFPNIPYDLLGPHCLLYDLVYNPEETKFLQHGKEKGARTKNGLEMLHLQAERSWAIWTSGDSFSTHSFSSEP